VKITCDHGYFFFEESRAGEVSDFASLFSGLSIVPKDHRYTFEDLEDAPGYSIAGNLYLGAPALKTFAGDPWEIFRENSLIYNFNLGIVQPISSVLTRIELVRAQNYFLSPGLILPGSLNPEGERVKSYVAYYLFDSARFKYSWVSYE
jgi:hypothetical protein